MDNLKITYIEEANELLSNLEIALLALENNANDRSCIEEVFRVMHTLKGNSSMFGLPVIAEFVHDLESIYDKIRNNEMLLSKELLDCSFLSLDHLKVIIHDSSLSDPANKKKHVELIETVNKLIKNNPGETKSTSEEKKSVKTFHIYFEPYTNIFENGTNPLYLIAELVSFGKSKTVPHFKLNSLSESSFQSCFSSWDIYLETEKTELDIRDVFVFVEDNSKITITDLNQINLLNNPQFSEYINRSLYQDSKIDITALKDFALTIGGNISTEIVTDQKTEKPVSTVPSETIEVKELHSKKDKTISSVRVSSDKLDELMNLVSELVTTQASLTLYSNNSKIQELEPIAENVEKLSRRLRDIAFGMTLVPIKNMFGRFQRMVRDVSGILSKEVDFITEGGETELDKSIIETLTDPLMHILRNSLDHGIETPEEREKKGKSRHGKLILKSFYSGVFVYIQIIDDGKGIDTEVVRNKAISKGLIKADDVLSENEIFNLIFYPGFSTAQKVTDVSGRGVGMDVVKRNISGLRGNIQIESKVNEGTTLTIKLPLTLSIIDGLLVVIDKVHYIVPLSAITKCYLVYNSEMANNFNKLLVLDDEQVPFINLREEFGHEFGSEGRSQVIVVHNGERRVGLSVDNIIGEYQAVIKPLGKHYKKQDFVSGASILGDGTIALVLDSNKLIELYINKTKAEEKYEYAI